jgi:hypothetical protein
MRVLGPAPLQLALPLRARAAVMPAVPRSTFRATAHASRSSGRAQLPAVPTLMRPGPAAPSYGSAGLN